MGGNCGKFTEVLENVPKMDVEISIVSKFAIFGHKFYSYDSVTFKMRMKSRFCMFVTLSRI